MRAAIYARFSSDLQDNRSITDQVAMARKYADGRGLKQIACMKMPRSPVPRSSTVLACNG